MDPMDLKNLHDEKKAATAEKAAAAMIAHNQKHDDLMKRTAAGRAAMKDVLLPYLNEIAATFDKGDFTVATPTVETDGVPACVSFRVGKGLEHCIECVAGNVRVFKVGPGSSAKSGGRTAGNAAARPVFVFSSRDEPFIATVDDLTREKVGKLVQIAINEAP